MSDNYVQLKSPATRGRSLVISDISNTTDPCPTTPALSQRVSKGMLMYQTCVELLKPLQFLLYLIDSYTSLLCPT